MNLIILLTLFIRQYVTVERPLDAPAYITFQENLVNPSSKFDAAAGIVEEGKA